MVASSRARRQYVAANLSLAWDCVLVNIAGDVYHAERGGQPVAMVGIVCLDRVPDMTGTLALPRITRAALTDSAHELGVKAAMHVWALIDGEVHTAWAVDVLRLGHCSVRDSCYRVPIASARQITMPVEPSHREPKLWHCELCGARHELAGMCHAASPAS